MWKAGRGGDVTAAPCFVLNNQRSTQSVKLQFAQIYFLDNVTITIQDIHAIATDNVWLFAKHICLLERLAASKVWSIGECYCVITNERVVFHICLNQTQRVCGCVEKMKVGFHNVLRGLLCVV
jgi:hypothetical protein